MQNLSPSSRYQLALSEGTHQPDDVQREAVNRPDTIYQEILAKPADAVQSSGLKAAFGRLLGKRAQGKRTGSWIIYVGWRWAG